MIPAPYLTIETALELMAKIIFPLKFIIIIIIIIIIITIIISLFTADWKKRDVIPEHQIK